MTDVNELQNTIRYLYGCDARHVESVPVTESFEGRIVWQGIVEVFELTGHPKAKRCFAWSYRAKKIVAVLELPPVVSAETAVRAAIVAASKPDP